MALVIVAVRTAIKTPSRAADPNAASFTERSKGVVWRKDAAPSVLRAIKLLRGEGRGSPGSWLEPKILGVTGMIVMPTRQLAA
jgi:hypothetical protein